MVKSLLNKLKVGACLVAAVASIGLASCKFPGQNPTHTKNYPPTATLSAYQEDNDPEIIVNLDGQDPDGKQDIVNYEVSVKDNSGKIIYDQSQGSPFSNVLIPTNNAGTFSVSGQCKDSQGAVGNAGPVQVIVNPPIQSPIIISGNFGDDENKGIKSGVIKAYDDSHKLLENILTDPNTGNFTVTIDPSISTINIILQAVSGTDVNPTSYLRTITIPKGNSSGNTMVVVPFESGWTSQDKDNFITHMGRLNFWSDAERIAEGISGGVTGNPFNGLKKWNHGELPDDINHPILKGVEVSSNDFSGPGSGTEYDQIKTIIHSSSCPNANNINVAYGESYNGIGGWGRIVLGNGSNSPGTIVWDQNGLDGYIEGFKTYLTHAQISNNIVRHEILGHGLRFPGHADGPSVIALFNSIMRYTGSDTRYSSTYGTDAPTDFTSTDIKGSYIIDGPTYKGMESENNTLGKYFLDSTTPIY